MSAFNNYNSQMPSHTLHDQNQPLPGVAGARPAVDYSADVFDRQPEPAGGWDRTHTAGVGSGAAHTSSTMGESAPKRAVHHAEAKVERGEARAEGAMARRRSSSSSSSSSDEGRRAGRRAAAAGSTAPGAGVSVGHHDETTATAHKPSVTDKLAGKTEKLVGKVTKNPAKVQEGEIRATEGKAAAAASNTSNF